MQRIVTILSLLFCLSLSYSQTYNQLVVDDKGKEKLLGKINREGLTSNSFKSWFDKNYDNYILNEKLINTIKDSLNDYTIMLFLGTWCGDSKREVPRFYKVLDAANFPEDQLEVIAVDRTPEAYKKSPTGEEKGLNIHRVPTFIFYKNGKEINRIVESPQATFEHDIKAIIEGKYTPKYVAANYIDGLIKQQGIDTLKTMETSLVSTLSEFVQGSRELNTFGYVRLRAKRFNEAIYVFDLNTKIFPYRDNVFDSLGEAYYESKNYSEALKSYKKVIEFSPKNENAMKMITKIEAIERTRR
ncbi:thioredoxin family protein [Pontimicrobium sp. SW4]|uniref:Thioredoxin family protein n=1 Tax=Pontimicrobium sp. SW4 TaxID=3153519 RepID=A0AAU7BT56_9FLAO